MVDCGLMFPDDAHLGGTLLFRTLSGQRHQGQTARHCADPRARRPHWRTALACARIKGNTHLWLPRLALALVEHKLREREILDWVELCLAGY